MSELELEYSEVLDFAIQNIPIIQSIVEIKEHWGHKIIDITKSRHELLRNDPLVFMSTTNMIIGQENYFFKFQAGKRLLGEFSVDFLPVSGTEYLREQIYSMAEGNKKTTTSNMRLANWRIQLFAKSFFPSISIKREYSSTLSWLISKLGKPNSDELTVEWASTARVSSGQNVNFWCYHAPEWDYIVTFYKLKGQHSISFSISEGM